MGWHDWYKPIPKRPYIPYVCLTNFRKI